MLGTGKYPDDYYPEGMLYGAALRSKYPRARVLSIDTSAAEALPGVEAVVTADDIPGENKLPLRMHHLFMMKKRLTYVLISTSAAEMRKKQSRIPST